MYYLLLFSLEKKTTYCIIGRFVYSFWKQFGFTVNRPFDYMITLLRSVNHEFQFQCLEVNRVHLECKLYFWSKSELFPKRIYNSSYYTIYLCVYVYLYASIYMYIYIMYRYYFCIYIFFKCSYIQNKTILFKVEKIAMWYSVLGEVDLNYQYDIECTTA
jgi:hypothetical protein